MSRLRKRVRIGKYAIPVLLLATLAIGTVAAAAYVVLTWTISLTVTANPRVHFYDGVDRENSLDITMDIFPDVKTIDEDSAWDISSTDAGNIYIRVSAMDTADVALVNITALDAGVQLFTQTWSVGTTSWSGPYGTDALTDYDLWIEITATSGAAAPSTGITVDLKVESP